MSTIPGFGVVVGSLFEWRRTPLIDVWSLTESLTRTATSVPGWYALLYRTQHPLTSVDPPGASYYEYSYLIRESRARFLIVGQHSSLVDRLFTDLGLNDNISPPAIDIPRLTIELATKPGAYSLSAVFARVDGYGQSIKSIALYGNDLAEAKLFGELLPQLVPYRVQLRDVRTGHEVLSIGSRGELSFFHRGAHSLRNVDIAFSFVSRLGYLSWFSETEATYGQGGASIS